MTNRAVAALVGAAITTVIAVTAVIGQWPIQEPLDTVAGVTWILLVVVTSADRITGSINQAAARLEQAGDARHAEGVIDGMRHATSPTPGLRGVH
jgi:hypothetical protein